MLDRTSSPAFDQTPHLTRTCVLPPSIDELEIGADQDTACRQEFSDADNDSQIRCEAIKERKVVPTLKRRQDVFEAAMMNCNSAGKLHPLDLAAGQRNVLGVGFDGVHLR